MFEDYVPAPEKNGRSSRDRAIGLLITLLVHTFLGFLVYYGRFTVKILPFAKKEEVRTVVIVPPLKVSIPKVVGGRGLLELPGGPREAAGPPSSEQRAAEPPGSPPEKETGGPAGEPGQTAGGTAAPTSFAIPSLSSRFQQSLAIHGKSGLTIPLAPPGTPPGPPGIGGGAPLPDFSKYNRGAPGGTGGGSGTGGRRGGSGPGGRQRVGISIPLKGYDLLPWASVVVDGIQKYWVLPSVHELPDVARISLIVVIKKSGELDSIEILEGTGIEVLDRSALEAVRAVLPFPALPADFPGDLLEITFEFVYND